MKLFNFMNFNNIGANTLQESNAFKKVRMFSKVYNSNLVHTPSTFTDKYIKLNSLYLTENDFNTSFNYGLKRQHNLTSSSATTNTFSTFLDSNSMNKFLTHNLNYNTLTSTSNDNTENFNLLNKTNNYTTDITNVMKLDVLFQNSNKYNNATLKTLALYPNLIQEMNDDSDKKSFNYPLRKLLNTKLTNSDVNNRNHIINLSSLEHNTPTTLNYSNFVFSNKSTTSKVFTAMSPNQSFLPSERSVRSFNKLTPNRAHYNLSEGFNSLDSNLKYISGTDVTTDLNSFYYLNKSN